MIGGTRPIFNLVSHFALFIEYYVTYYHLILFIFNNVRIAETYCVAFKELGVSTLKSSDSLGFSPKS